MNGFIDNIEKLTENNTYFRRVLYTAPHSQLVLMCVEPSDEIGMEVHNDNDQFFRIETGTGLFVIEDDQFPISEGFAMVVPAGTKHNVINTSKDKQLKIYTIYSPAHHPDGTIHKTKDEAIAAEK